MDISKCMVTMSAIIHVNMKNAMVVIGDNVKTICAFISSLHSSRHRCLSLQVAVVVIMVVNGRPNHKQIEIVREGVCAAI